MGFALIQSGKMNYPHTATGRIQSVPGITDVGQGLPNFAAKYGMPHPGATLITHVMNADVTAPMVTKNPERPLISGAIADESSLHGGIALRVQIDAALIAPTDNPLVGVLLEGTDIPGWLEINRRRLRTKKKRTSKPACSVGSISAWMRWTRDTIPSPLRLPMSPPFLKE